MVGECLQCYGRRMGNQVRELRNRWQTELGRRVALSLERIAPGGPTREQVVHALSPLADLEAVPSGLDFRGFEGDLFLFGVDLSGASFAHSRAGVRLKNCTVSGLVFSDADIALLFACTGKRLVGVRSKCSSVAHSTLEDSNFDKCNWRGANLTGARLARSTFRSSRLTMAVMVGSDLTGCDLQNALLDNAAMQEVILDGTTDLRGASLKGVFHEDHYDYSGNLVNRGTDLTRARLSEVPATGPNALNVEMADALLRHATKSRSAKEVGLPGLIRDFATPERLCGDPGAWVERLRAELSPEARAALDALLEPAMRDLL